MGLFRDELGKSYDELAVGQTAMVSRKVTKQDILQYMSLSGDLNPVYADSTYAGRTKYGTTIVPANMLAGFAMGAVATLLPGVGSLTLAHSYRLVRPPNLGDEITAHMEIVEMKPAERQVVVRYTMTDQQGQALLSGDMLVEPPEVLRPIMNHAFENF